MAFNVLYSNLSVFVTLWLYYYVLRIKLNTFRPKEIQKDLHMKRGISWKSKSTQHLPDPGVRRRKSFFRRPASITRSPAAIRFTISSSATSNPGGTCKVFMLAEEGVLSGWFATSVSCTPVLPAARNRISLITTGQASASTQIFKKRRSEYRSYQ